MSPRASVAVAVAGVVLAVLPVFLVGALAGPLRADLEMGPADIGRATAVFFGVAGLTATSGGRVVRRLGTVRSMVVAASLTSACLVGIAVAGHEVLLLGALALGGLGNTLFQPAANSGLAHAVRVRLGLALGVKQAAIPAATLISGLAVPAIALTLGWRWVFVLGAGVGLALVLALTLHGYGAPGSAGRTTRPPRLVAAAERRGLVGVSIGAGLGSAAATSIGVFAVDAVVTTGVGPGRAGLVLAAGSVLGMISRVLLGWRADAWQLRTVPVVIACLMLTGSASFLIMAFGAAPFLVVGILLAYAAGWAWPGLLHYGLVAGRRESAAVTTGLVQTGMSLGAACGPLLIGYVAERASYAGAWCVAAGLAAVGALLVGRRFPAG